MAAATLLSGCSSEENPAPPTPVPLMISVGVDRLTSRAGVVTGEAFANEQKINVILVDETLLEPPTPEYPAMSQYSCSITGVSPNEVTTWAPVYPTQAPIVVMNRATVLAHYPAVLPNASALSTDRRTLEINIPAEIPYGEISDLNANAVPINMTDISPEVWFVKGDEDYMTGYGGTVSALPTTPGAPETAQNKTTIAMKHALAMVVVQFTMDDTNPDKDKTIDGLWVKNANPATGPFQKGGVTLIDNVFSPNGTRIDYSRPMANFPIADKYYFGLLAYPATIEANGVEIVCSVGAAKYTYKVPAVTWEAGLVYLYTLKLTSASGVLSEGVRVVDWPAAIEKEIVVE